MRKSLRNKHVRTAVATLLASSSVAVSLPAYAQSAAAEDTDEIVVTAQKREQNLQDVPVAITAIGRRQADADVVNFETQGDSELNHIIVAEGVFVGDLVWQNQLAADLGKVALRQ